MTVRSRFGVWQPGNTAAERRFRGKTYGDLCLEGIPVDPADYVPVYMAGMREGDSVRSVVKRLTAGPPDSFPGHPVTVADVIVLIVDEHPTAWYVNGPDGDLTLLPGFFPDTGEEETRQICLNGGPYELAGREGTWVPCRESLIGGIPLYEMTCAEDPRALHMLVTFDRRIVSENFLRPGEREWTRAGVLLDRYRELYENGTYVRFPPDPEEELPDPNRPSLEQLVRTARREEKEKSESERKRKQERARNVTEAKIAAAGQLPVTGPPPEPLDKREWALPEQPEPERPDTGDALAACLSRINARLDAMERRLGAEETDQT